MAVALLGAGITVHAQTSAKDSMRVVKAQFENLGELVKNTIFVA